MFLWLFVALLIAWVVFWATVKVISVAFWILLGLAAAALIAHFVTRKSASA
jgi:hypothetical protein